MTRRRKQPLRPGPAALLGALVLCLAACGGYGGDAGSGGGSGSATDPGGTVPVSGGPYRYVKHPNYVSVVIEIALIPLLFSCYITSAVFSALNFILLWRRIKIEERALLGLSGQAGRES